MVQHQEPPSLNHVVDQGSLDTLRHRSVDVHQDRMKGAEFLRESILLGALNGESLLSPQQRNQAGKFTLLIGDEEERPVGRGGLRRRETGASNQQDPCCPAEEHPGLIPHAMLVLFLWILEGTGPASAARANASTTRVA